MAKNNGKTWLYAGVGALLAVVMVAGSGAVISRKEGDYTLKASDYQGCMLDDITGKKDTEDKTGISTKDFIEFDMLKSIEVGKNDVTYYVNCYSKDKKFIQVDEYSADLTELDFIAYKNLGVKYIKIEVVSGEDDKISLFDISKVSKLIEVELGEAEEDQNTDEEQVE